MDGSDGLSGGETKDNAGGNEIEAERTARLAGEDPAGAGPLGALPSTPIVQQNNVLTAAELAQHDADALHDQLCTRVLTHLHGFMTATQSPELDTECYAALRGQTQGQLAALGDLLMQAGGLHSQMETAERTAMHLDNTSLGQDMNEMADINVRLRQEHAELRKEADSLRAAAVLAEQARIALAAAHTAQAQQPNPLAAAHAAGPIGHRHSYRFPPVNAAPPGTGVFYTPRQAAFAGATPATGETNTSTISPCCSNDSGLYQESAGQLHSAGRKALCSFRSYGAGRWPVVLML
jgi:hypothetical protein